MAFKYLTTGIIVVEWLYEKDKPIDFVGPACHHHRFDFVGVEVVR